MIYIYRVQFSLDNMSIEKNLGSLLKYYEKYYEYSINIIERMNKEIRRRIRL